MFYTPVLLVVFHRRLSDSRSSRVSRTMCLLADFNNAVVLMVFILPLISNTSSPFSKPLGACSKCSKYYWYHRHLYVSQFSLVLWQGSSIWLSFRLFHFKTWDPPVLEILLDDIFFFILLNSRFCFLVRISWFVWISKSLRSIYVSFS